MSENDKQLSYDELILLLQEARVGTQSDFENANSMHFDTWKQAVKLAGYEYFISDNGWDRPLNPLMAIDYEQLVPDISSIERSIHRMDISRALFLASIVYLINTKKGTTLLTLVFHRHNVAANEEWYEQLSEQHIHLLRSLMLYEKSSVFLD